MKTKNAILTGLGVLLASGLAFAQEEDEPKGVTYATYLYCDTNKEASMDEQVAEFDAPVMDKLVKDGVMNAWGWMRHHTGGEWRRIRWFSADSVQDAIDALDAMGDALDEAAEDSDRVPSDACPHHDDYIWQVESTSSADASTRGKVGMSVYYSCEISGEARADEIFDELFAPVLNKYVEDGKLSSWGWQSHIIGGWFRRLQTITADDYATLLAARQEALDTVYAEGSKLGAEFAEICGPHHDYLWDNVH
jgi:hypothetical protein